MAHLASLKTVVRACIAMKYPPRLMAGPNRQYQWRSLIGANLTETIPRSPSKDVEVPMVDLIHFDIDPQNGETSPVL